LGEWGECRFPHEFSKIREQNDYKKKETVTNGIRLLNNRGHFEKKIVKSEKVKKRVCTEVVLQQKTGIRVPNFVGDK